ncbi:MAG: head GIN domain-containing protein [Candidatus Bathyarchaeota archaeon]|jgi:hypothetical protein
MSRKQLKANTHAISTLTIVLIIIIAVASVVAVVVAAVMLGFREPVVGSGIFDTEKKDLTDFTIVEVGWGFEVKISQSDSYSINIKADDNMFDYIEVSQTGDTLTIGLKWDYSYQNVTLKAEITMPDLHELTLSGGTHGTAKEFTSSHDFDLSLSGGSTISLEGAANDLTISGSGGSHLYLSDFHVHDATVNLSGGSSATVNLDGRLDGDLSGGSHLKYVGNPTTVDVNTSGGSSVGPQ